MKWRTFIRIMKKVDPCADTKIARLRDCIEEETGIKQGLNDKVPIGYIHGVLKEAQKGKQH